MLVFVGRIASKMGRQSFLETGQEREEHRLAGLCGGRSGGALGTRGRVLDHICGSKELGQLRKGRTEAAETIPRVEFLFGRRTRWATAKLATKRHGGGCRRRGHCEERDTSNVDAWFIYHAVLRAGGIWAKREA